MTVKGYLVLSNDSRWFKPYLFESEAKEIAELMTVLSGRAHWLGEIELDRLLNVLTEFNGVELMLDVKNIKISGDGFEGEAVIEGRTYVVRQGSPFELWYVTDEEEPQNAASAPLEKQSAEPNCANKIA